ncbi:MAG: tetratricopeptide repeat protein [Phycisphaerales bacterium]|nr:tetratricopeptide repeat protein [Phycisphaerales bacterium]
MLRSEGRHQEAIDLLTASEPAARRVFTGGHAPRLAHILAILARAQVGLGYQAERFKAAEANLVEAYSIVPPTKSTALACEQGLCDLYTAWHAAEPGKGYDTKAAEWKAKLESPSTPSEDKKP